MHGLLKEFDVQLLSKQLDARQGLRWRVLHLLHLF